MSVQPHLAMPVIWLGRQLKMHYKICQMGTKYLIYVTKVCKAGCLSILVMDLYALK